MGERLISTINNSDVLEHHVPACCEVKNINMNTRTICKKERGCTVKVCYFRDEYEKEKKTGTTLGVIKNAT